MQQLGMLVQPSSTQLEAGSVQDCQLSPCWCPHVLTCLPLGTIFFILCPSDSLSPHKDYIWFSWSIAWKCMFWLGCLSQGGWEETNPGYREPGGRGVPNKWPHIWWLTAAEFWCPEPWHQSFRIPLQPLVLVDSYWHTRASSCTIPAHPPPLLPSFLAVLVSLLKSSSWSSMNGSPCSTQIELNITWWDRQRPLFSNKLFIDVEV